MRAIESTLGKKPFDDGTGSSHLLVVGGKTTLEVCQLIVAMRDDPAVLMTELVRIAIHQDGYNPFTVHRVLQEMGIQGMPAIDHQGSPASVVLPMCLSGGGGPTAATLGGKVPGETSPKSLSWRKKNNRPLGLRNNLPVTDNKIFVAIYGGKYTKLEWIGTDFRKQTRTVNPDAVVNQG